MREIKFRGWDENKNEYHKKIVQTDDSPVVNAYVCILPSDERIYK